MRQIIQGKRYDTETATLVGEASHGYGGDFSSWEAGLWRTPRGAFFLAGEGGPMTRWARSVDHSTTSGGRGIIPLSREEARGWAEDHLGTDVLEQFFPDMIRDA